VLRKPQSFVERLTFPLLLPRTSQHYTVTLSSTFKGKSKYCMVKHIWATVKVQKLFMSSTV